MRVWGSGVACLTRANYEFHNKSVLGHIQCNTFRGTAAAGVKMKDVIKRVLKGNVSGPTKKTKTPSNNKNHRERSRNTVN